MKTLPKNDGVARSNAGPTDSVPPADFLERESERAYGAVKQRVHDISDRINPAVAVDKIVKRHPWRALAWASAIGFSVGALLTRRKRHRVPAEPTIEPPTPPSSPPTTLSTPPPDPRLPWWSSLIGPTLEVAKILTERRLLAAISRKNKAPK